MKKILLILSYSFFANFSSLHTLYAQEVIHLRVGNKYTYLREESRRTGNFNNQLCCTRTTITLFTEEITKDSVINGVRYFLFQNSLNLNEKFMRADSINTYIWSTTANRELPSFGLTMGGWFSVDSFTPTSATQSAGGAPSGRTVYYSGYECDDINACIVGFIQGMTVTKGRNGIDASIVFLQAVPCSHPKYRTLNYSSPFGVTSFSDYHYCTARFSTRPTNTITYISGDYSTSVKLISCTLNGQKYTLQTNGTLDPDTISSQILATNYIGTNSLVRLTPLAILPIQSEIRTYTLDNETLKMQIEFEQKNEGKINLGIYSNASYMIQKVIEEKNYSVGLHKINIDVSMLPKGQYSIQLSGNNGTDFRSFEIK